MFPYIYFVSDPSQWDSASVLSWIRWTSRQFNLPEPVSEQWDMIGTNLITLAEDDFTRRSPQVRTFIIHLKIDNEDTEFLLCNKMPVKSILIDKKHFIVSELKSHFVLCKIL